MDPHAWTLRTRLIAVMVALVAATSVVIGAVTLIVLSRIYSSQFDLQVQNAAQNVGQIIRETDGDQMNPRFADQAVIIVGPTATGGTVGYYLHGESRTPLTEAQLRPILALGRDPQLSRPNATPRALQVPGYGEYRFVGAAPFTNVLVGESSSQLNRQIGLVLLPITLVVVAAIVLAALIGALVVGRALRPLRRVATVASNVAGMRLDRGDVHLVQRVPGRYTNPHTEVGQVGSALNSLLESVESALAVRQASEEKVRTFVADASHELRTPLASIRGYAELTRRFGGDLDETVQHNIGRIESEAQRMTALVEDLLLLARLDAERELDTTDVDLSRLLVDVVSDAHAAGRDHEWDFELPDEPVVVRGDDAKLHQVFTNLLANARVHTPAGTAVTVELRPPVGDRVTVLVKDTGPGIPPELQPNLFQRFVRGDSSRQRRTGSTGLGLSIVNAVVEAHHGTVTVESQPGSTVFTVTLPVHQPAVTEPAPAPSPSPEPVPA
ncbi:HAMP domain-containing sensor histidine kinase [Amnibacterium sp. CER49]|uniref:sensor histidine kinase n=1 Tax=Amnibacterium sp. CER49 TaxID=3039161 RepID=UPI002447A868|nr:HAMP domain-containing sensor histidine kinase [Amnibacterium sp. CER49]MDH2443295.1 HAMP domain-containing sensor histidine kinase [Amnibacterium sp. CER49]